MPAATRRWPPILITAIAIVGVGIFAYLYSQARGERDDAEAALASAQSDLEDTEALLEEAEAHLADAEEDLDAANDGILEFVTLALTTGAGLEEDAGECIAETLLQERGPQIMLEFTEAAGSPGPEAFELGIEMMGAAVDCGVPPDAFADGSSQELLPGFSYGDNPTLDALQDDCTAGSGAACDQLFLQSQIGSEYETFGSTCGGRFTSATRPELCDGNI